MENNGFREKTERSISMIYKDVAVLLLPSQLESG